MTTNMNKKILSFSIILLLIMGISFSYKYSRELKFTEDNSEIIAYTNNIELLRNEEESYEPVGENFCEDSQSALQFIGYIILFIKILVPLAIIFVGSFDYYKAVSTGKEEDLKKQTGILMKRVIAGLIIFFIPTILNFAFKTVDKYSSIEEDYKICAKCLFNPTECEEN